MISHVLSSRMTGGLDLWANRAIPGTEVRRVVCVRSAWSAGYGPLRVAYDAATRLQRARVDSRFLPLRAQPRRLRRPLLLSGTGSPRDRRRGKCADGGDRGIDGALSPVL